MGKGKKSGKSSKKQAAPQSFSDALRAGEGFVLGDLDPRSTPAFKGDKADGQKALDARADEFGDWQERLYAEAKWGGERSLLLVVQGMDTSGKGGIMRHVVGHMDPQGVRYTAFKAPTAEERKHPFLWRIRNALPDPGQIGVFDRSQYEDVLIARVDSLVPEDVWRGRYDEINAFEAELADNGVTVLKCMLHISPDEQKERLLARLDDPAKRWKYNPGDLDARAKWSRYQEAYVDALRFCDTDAAPWYVVPSDRKWYRNWVVAALLAETLAELEPQFPETTFDVEAERARVEASPVG
jgi:PPK2 family polyphosphate:nucleotide phosphotransferase